ncbi:omega amidase NIT2 [Trichuris trichiura]|uniref:omega-amidase n=1 Tax=Trichuris trichiura TaxID=36087 RepID=A0A077Z2H3_TRITR|nr:omega amidase NIT2 [Trichuris trichiura]
MSKTAQEFTVGVVQVSALGNQDSNLSSVALQIVEAARLDANVVVLPEYFTCPRGFNDIREYAEPLDGSGRTFSLISSLAQSLGIYIIAGTVPEMENGAYYNTCCLFNRNGDLVGKYRKKYRLNVLGEFLPNETQVAFDVNEPVIFRTEFVDIGIGTGNDIHLPQLALAYAAADSAEETIGCSTIISPWGDCLKSTKDKNEVICEKFCMPDLGAKCKKMHTHIGEQAIGYI